MSKVVVCCENCRKKTLKWPRDLRKCKHHFCSKKCVYDWRRKHPRSPANFKNLILKCDYCGKTFHRPPANVKNSKCTFCSKECHINYFRQKVVCPVCNKVFIRSKSRIKCKKSFCSIRCSSKWHRGRNNPNFRRVKRTCLNCSKIFETRPSCQLPMTEAIGL